MRELQNRLQRAVLLCGGGVIAPDHLGLGLKSPLAEKLPPAAVRASTAQPGGTLAAPSPAEATSRPFHPDRAVVEEALGKAGGIVSRAAAELGISRQAFYRRMDQAGVVLERRLKVLR